MKRKRLPILDEMVESCRLLPTWMQSIFFFIAMVCTAYIVPVVTFSFTGMIMTIQVILIILLIRKNMVYRQIAKMNTAIKKKIIWIHTRKDRKDRMRKIGVNLILVGLTSYLFLLIQNMQFLIINGLFCFLFSLKILFYVPLVSVRLLDEDDAPLKFCVIDKGENISTEINVCDINSIEMDTNKIRITTKEEKTDVPIDFISNDEMDRLFQFLKGLKRFDVKFQG